MFADLENLKAIFLNSNKLNFIHANAFETNEELERLFLHGNSLKTVETAWFSKLSNLRELYFDGNPINCNCGIQDFIDYANEKKLWDLMDNNYPQCASPVGYERRILKDLLQEELATTCSEPVITRKIYNDVNVKLDGEIKIPCVARGEPSPDITWFFTSASGPETDVDVGSDTKDATLYIPKARLEDSGTYTCIAQSFINKQLKEDKMVVRVNVEEHSLSPDFIPNSPDADTDINREPNQDIDKFDIPKVDDDYDEEEDDDDDEYDDDDYDDDDYDDYDDNCPDDCYCDKLNSKRFIDCKDVDLNSIPRGIGEMNPTHLDLRDNDITTIEEDSFDDMEDLIELNLDGNENIQIDRDDFYILENLKTITLSKTGLKQIGTMFMDMDSLEKIVLTNNNLRSLHRVNFQDLTNLQKLYLGNNEIETVDAETFLSLHNLKYLYLANNKLHKIDPLWFSAFTEPIIIRVDLKGNPISCDCQSLGGFADYVKDHQWILDPVLDIDGETCDFRGKEIDMLDAIDEITEEKEENPNYCEEKENDERERVQPKQQLDDPTKEKKIQEAIAEQEAIETANIFKPLDDRIGSDYNIDDHADDQPDGYISKSTEPRQSNTHWVITTFILFVVVFLFFTFKRWRNYFLRCIFNACADNSSLQQILARSGSDRPYHRPSYSYSFTDRTSSRETLI